MRRESRLRHRKDFDVIFKRGARRANRLLVLRSLANNLTYNRYAFITSKRVGKAVVRNRVRRRLREALRALPIRAGWDIVFSARASAAEASYQELERAVSGLVRSAGLVNTDASTEEKRK